MDVLLHLDSTSAGPPARRPAGSPARRQKLSPDEEKHPLELFVRAKCLLETEGVPIELFVRPEGFPETSEVVSESELEPLEVEVGLEIEEVAEGVFFLCST